MGDTHPELEQITVLLKRLSAGDSSAETPLADAVYSQLRLVAHGIVGRDPRYSTLQATGLVNTVLLELLRIRSIDWKDREHFFRTASRMLRRRFVDHIRSRRAAKRPPAHSAAISYSCENQASRSHPEFYKTQAMRLPIWDKPRVISCSEEFAQHIALPRGCVEDVSALLKDHCIQISIRDERYSGKPIAVSFQGNLRDDRAEAVRQTLRHNEGVLFAPTAFGKTVVAAKVIAERGVNTLVLVHRQQLLEQWRARLAMFLDLPANAIGQVMTVQFETSARCCSGCRNTRSRRTKTRPRDQPRQVDYLKCIQSWQLHQDLDCPPSSSS
jgi:hypothetical protein